MGSISQLLRWKKSVILRNETGSPIIDSETHKPTVVWVRIITDKDLEDAFKKARIASAKMRVDLTNPETDEYKALIAPFDDADRQACYDMSLAGMGANWLGEALSNVVRPELPKIKEVASDPDAPTLEDQEKLDALIAKTEKEYQKALEEFIETKQTEARAILDDLTDEELREQAKLSVIVTLPLETFLAELQIEKIWRAVYSDEACTERGFTDAEDFRATVTVIRDQLAVVYDELERGHSDLKN